jgi:multicomponent Na+:H+ antiporter subunit B
MGLLVMTAFSVVFMRDLFAIVMLFGIYSLVSAGFFVNLDAVDVALTEAAVGAGISTILMLGTLAITTRSERRSNHGPLLPLLVVAVTGAALIYGTLDMPHFTDPDAPIHTHVAPRYIGQSGMETGVPNIVTSVLASYRGFDTLGETIVIFTAGIGVLALLGRFGPRPATAVATAPMSHHLILRVIAKALIPLILLYALYIQFHGDYGPGGGFQAGVMFAVAFILYAIVFGTDRMQQVIPPRVLHVVMAAGVLLYGGVGIASMLLGGEYLDYNVLAHDPVHGQHLGILLVELGVGITVSAVMLSIYSDFTCRNSLKQVEEK